MGSDFPRCELLLVFGTSLMVQPFASLVRRVPARTPRMLINGERRGEDLGMDFDHRGQGTACFLVTVTQQPAVWRHCLGGSCPPQAMPSPLLACPTYQWGMRW